MSQIIDDKVNYWKDLWENLIDNFLKKSYGLNLYSPHILVEDIILEIEENTNNADNRKYFKSKLDHYYNNDIVLKNCFESDFKILRTILHTSKVNLILEICRNLEKKFKEGKYFDENLKELKALLFNDCILDKEIIYRITEITQRLIIEFIKKGYILEDIKRIAKNIFDNYQSISNGKEDIIATYFPHNILHDDYTKDGKLDRESINNAIVSMMKTLTTEQRINKLSYYFYKEPEEAFYVFVVEGLKGDINLSLCDVTFYSPDQTRYAKEDSHNDEDLQSDKDIEDKFIQAAVKVKYLTSASSLISALAILEKTIDLLHSYYNTKYKIEIDSSKYIVIQHGNIIQNSWGRNDRFLKMHDSLNINKYEKNMRELNDFNFLFLQDNKTISKLSNAIHWYSKAQHSSNQEDKILNYWIAIENLFSSEFDILKDDLLDKNISKLKLIQLIISSNQIPSFIYEYGWEIFNHYSHLARNKHFYDNFELPDEVIDKANLNVKEGEPIFLEKFINSLQDIKKYEKNHFLLGKLENLIGFYKNSSVTMKVVEEQIKLIEEDILMIYRLRNLIVHNAHFDNALLPYHVWKIKEYSGNLIRRLLYQFKKNNSNLSSLLINIYLRREKLLHELENNKANLFT
ncbi:hypothetical protein [Elizabethkingia anophelis]|uniref:hypothetical protein n=1 Tax=Elizabethkingia anophelis TaxID=1117645 RepID=UPI0038923868